MIARRTLVLTGPPGAGKSMLGRALATALGRSYADLDDVVAKEAGCTTETLLVRDGEPAFRSREARAFDRLLDDGIEIVATGGGALLDPARRHATLRRAHILGLGAPLAVLSARARSGRPLLGADPSTTLPGLLAGRAAAYAEAHAQLETTAPLEVLVPRALALVAALEEHPTLLVPLGQRSYPIHIDSLAALPRHVDPLRASSVVLVTDENVQRALGARMPALHETARVVLSGVPADKALPALERIWDEALRAGVDRDALIVGIGGGVVTDLAGFAAATLLRGLRVVACPTTLLAMVDASVGGKTGIDHARGKNLLGAFHQPSLVLCDPRLLEGLPAAALREGLAEIAKVALSHSPALAAMLRSDHARLARLEAGALAELVPAAIQAKIDLVSLDERDRGARELLNFGHTIGHAIEHAMGYTVPHGECVALGMRAELELGRALGITPSSIAAQAIALLDSLALPRVLPAGLARAAVGAALTRDKKRRAGALRVVLLGAEHAGVFPFEAEAALSACDRLAPR